jgi:hypothetical protein
MKVRNFSLLGGAILVAIAGAMLVSAPGRADDKLGIHGQGHDLMHGWYQSLKQPGTGISCCNNEDCRPTISRTLEGKIQVQVDGEWTDVPPERIVNTPSPDLGAHVCAPKRMGFSHKALIYCVVLGSGV